VTATEIIEEIKRLPKPEQIKVAEFARKVAAALSPEELGELAERMVQTQDKEQADRMEKEIIRGFYGDEPHA